RRRRWTTRVAGGMMSPGHSAASGPASRISSPPLSNATVSVPLDRLPWTTRDGVAATLVAMAHGPSLDAAERAVRLLREVATPGLLPEILGIALRRDRSATVRTWALGILAAHEGYAVPDEALGALLEEQPLVLPAHCGWPDVPSC